MKNIFKKVREKWEGSYLQKNIIIVWGVGIIALIIVLILVG